MEEESHVSLTPYAKRSKMVSRHTMEEVPNMSSADCSHSDFWDRLVQQQSSPWMDEYHEAPSLLMSGYAAQRPAEAEGDPFPWQVLPTSQRLPPPKELCRRKKRGAKLPRPEKGGVLSVCHHLEELKRRQSSIDELKKATWGGCLPQPFNGGYSSAASLHHGGLPGSPFSMPGSALPHFCEKEDLLVFQRCRNRQLLSPDWPSHLRDQQRMPPGSPAFSYTMATLGRPPVAAVCQPEEDFGGFQLQSEE